MYSVERVITLYRTISFSVDVISYRDGKYVSIQNRG